MFGATYGRVGNSKSLNISELSRLDLSTFASEESSSSMSDKQESTYGGPKHKETKSELPQNEW